MIMEEMWLIDAGRLKRVLQRFEEHLTALGLHKRADVVKTIIKGLKLQPKIDAVPVVRCKDCINSDLYSNIPCYLFCMKHHMLVEKDDFCSCGEREADEGKAE